jgi:hypothetical protein
LIGHHLLHAAIQRQSEAVEEDGIPAAVGNPPYLHEFT